MITKTEIQLIRSLAQKSGRTDTGLFVAEGHKFIGEIIMSPLRLRKIYALQELFDGTGVQSLSESEMARISLLKTASNSLALIEIPKYKLSDIKIGDDLILALDNVQNPGNLGTIIRLADWFGITDIVCSEDSADCFNPKVVQATMGAILRVRVHYTNLPGFLSEQRTQGVPIYGTFLEGESIYKTSLTQTGIIVMGNEGRGVSPATEEQITHRIFIPPYPAHSMNSESLNVAMATGVVCSEFRRQALIKP